MINTLSFFTYLFQMHYSKLMTEKKYRNKSPEKMEKKSSKCNNNKCIDDSTVKETGIMLPLSEFAL